MVVKVYRNDILIYRFNLDDNLRYNTFGIVEDIKKKLSDKNNPLKYSIQSEYHGNIRAGDVIECYEFAGEFSRKFVIEKISPNLEYSTYSELSNCKINKQIDLETKYISLIYNNFTTETRNVICGSSKKRIPMWVAYRPSGRIEITIGSRELNISNSKNNVYIKKYKGKNIKTTIDTIEKFLVGEL